MGNAVNIAGLALPVPAGAITDAFNDPVAIGLLDYCAHWLNWGLNARLSMQVGTSATAVPTANRFAFNPSTVFVRRSIPALYCWGEGSPEAVEWTQMTRIVRRDLKLTWVFDELVSPNGLTMRNGLLNAVDMLLNQAVEQLAHDTWPVAGGLYTAPVGTGVLTVLGLSAIAKTGCEYGAMWQVPGDGGQIGGPGDGSVQFGYPSLRATFRVEAVVDTSTRLEDEDALMDGPVTIDAADGGFSEPVYDFVSFYAEGQDAVEED